MGENCCQNCNQHIALTTLLKLRLISDILEALDRGDLAPLTLLDRSAAFDTVDHTILTRRLETSYGVCFTVLKLFQTYLEQRM